MKKTMKALYVFSRLKNMMLLLTLGLAFLTIIFFFLFITDKSQISREEGVKLITIIDDIQIQGFSLSVYAFDLNFSRKDYIYYFHGQGGDLESWKTDLSELCLSWEENPKESPIIIAVSLGKEGMVLPQTSSPESGKDQIFVHCVIPEIEKSIGHTPEYRIISGRSMGATSGASLFFRYPNVFDSAILVSPGIYPFSVFADENEIIDFTKSFSLKELTFNEIILKYVKKKSIRVEDIKAVLSVQKRYYGSDEEWRMSRITNLISQSAGGRRLYVSSAPNDTLGFYPGVIEMVNLARTSDYEVVWDPLKNGHMSINPKGILDFIQGSRKE